MISGIKNLRKIQAGVISIIETNVEWKNMIIEQTLKIFSAKPLGLQGLNIAHQMSE
jgi:hypothetical protein